jgi:hypothetical protein
MSPYESPQTAPVPKPREVGAFFAGFVWGITVVLWVLVAMQALRAYGWI